MRRATFQTHEGRFKDVDRLAPRIANRPEAFTFGIEIARDHNALYRYPESFMQHPRLTRVHHDRQILLGQERARYQLREMTREVEPAPRRQRKRVLRNATASA